MKFLILLFFGITIYASEINLDNLLKKYQDAESLYKKTKKENAGFLISYSREDLEQMQAYQLKDILKTVRMFSLLMTPIGSTSIEKASTNNRNMNAIKLFIDDFEITSLMQSNPIELYIDMDLYFVDHVEIYQGGSSISFGNEPGTMVIRLYSKNPCRENSTSFEIGVDSFGSYNTRFIDAGKINKYQYLGYANIKSTKYKNYLLNNKTLSRDFKSYQTHFKFSQKNNFNIEFDTIVNNADAFKGLASNPSETNQIKRAYTYFSFTKYFINNLKLSISLSREYKKAEVKDEYGFISAYNKLNKSFYTDTNSKIYKAILEKKFIIDKHDFLLGSQLVRKELNIKNYLLDGVMPNFELNRLNIFTIYLEELYSFDKDNLISLSAKVDTYNDNVNETNTQHSLRLAYIKLLDNHWKSKIFLTRRYLYPNGMQSSFTMPIYKPNPELKSFTLKNISGELQYNDENTKMVFGLANMEIYNPIIFDKVNKIYKNSDKNISYQRIYVRGEYKFNLNNKIILEYFKMYKSRMLSSGSGFLMQSFNKIGKFDVYNEITYRDSYNIQHINIDDGYDWTTSISYAIDKQMTVKVKGENILDSAIKTLVEPSTLLKTPVYERRFIITMEYTF